ncbi:Flp pilus assembly protein CpaB [Noviherbaspirillum cavernae]|uniref:Flp pilus assembly protein CpaB n=1 Tax=Noviherbaspirillum cavernae TaxID=2320862 RepID=A0A418WWD1_9BURK|nr:Flp pilus assembly protein CpaB [Noviherbaspirillum cavernae]RJF96958.1 Flp pilus assembly protein CpaB [Noviherbaspirillum cavernae]
MKNIKAIVLLFLAVVIGLAAAVYAAGWVSQQGGIASNKVVVAAVDIELGSKVTPQMLSTVDWPSGAMPPGAFKDVKELQDRVVKASILRGEAVLEGKLAPAGTQGGLSAVIAEGKRAMTVRVNDVVGVAGFALPGNHVDVMLNTQQDKDGKDGEARQISKTVLENVLVLAVAQEASRDETKPKVVNAVTLELSLEDSEKLDLARNVGTLSLVLRNQIDKKSVKTAGVTKKQLFGEAPVKIADKPKPVAARPAIARSKPVELPPAQCVEVIQHGTRALNCF